MLREWKAPLGGQVVPHFRRRSGAEHQEPSELSLQADPQQCPPQGQTLLCI